MRVLYADSDRLISISVVKELEKNHYSVDDVQNGDDAFYYLRSGGYDAAVLDVSMSGMSSLEIIKKIREKGDQIPVMLIASKSTVEERVTGLDAGANDFMTKPYDLREFMAHIRVLTRSKTEKEHCLRYGNVCLDRYSYELSTPTGTVRLANKEYQLLEYFLSNPHQLLPIERLFERIWGHDCETGTNVVWVYMAYLRKKLKAVDANVYLRVSRNVGYALEDRKGI